MTVKATLRELQLANAWVKKRFVYTPDSKTHPKLTDHWEDHYERLMADPKYIAKDDCDGLANTVVETLLRRGYPRDKLLIAAVAANGAKKIDHLIGLAETDDNRTFIVGDTFSDQPVPLAKCPHKIISFMRMSKPGKVIAWAKPGKVIAWAKRSRELAGEAEAPNVRAVRNSNPGNLEKGQQWQGLAAEQTDSRFCTFKHPKWGFRAMAITLITYQDKRRAKDGSKIDTIRDVIERWAPDFENNVGAYIKSVDKNHPKTALQELDFHTYEDLAPLVKAMAIHECGGWYFKDADLRTGLALAGVPAPIAPLARDPIVVPGATAAGATAGAGFITEVLDPLRTSFTEMAFYMDIAKYALFALIVVSAGITIWQALKRREQDAR